MTTPKKNTSSDGKKQVPRRTRGPVFAIKDGQMGLSFACGHFVAMAISGEAGARAKDVFRLIMPCPMCYPKGAAFHQRMVLSAQVPQVLG